MGTFTSQALPLPSFLDLFSSPPLKPFPLPLLSPFDPDLDGHQDDNSDLPYRRRCDPTLYNWRAEVCS